MNNKQTHNKEVRSSAESRASEMRTWPSPLEERMIAFLDKNNVQYESQKTFYIYADDGWIIRYYIADFYIPDRKLIIEVDGRRYHEHHSQHDKMRTRNIQEHYPDVKVLRYTWEDLSNEDTMRGLLIRLME